MTETWRKQNFTQSCEALICAYDFNDEDVDRRCLQAVDQGREFVLLLLLLLPLLLLLWLLEKAHELPCTITLPYRTSDRFSTAVTSMIQNRYSALPRRRHQHHQHQHNKNENKKRKLKCAKIISR